MYNDNEFEFEGPEFGHEFEMEMEGSYEASDNGASYEFDQEYLRDDESESESEDEGEEEMGYGLSENQEMELAHELLSVQSEQELDQFLGSLIKKAGRAVRGAVRSPLFKKLGGVLKNVARKALPIAGGAIGTFFGGPLGGAVGSKLGGFASKMFELELEGLSPEDQEFETARAYVRFANAATRNTAALHRRQPHKPASALVRQALAKAAHQHAPGLLRPRNTDGTFRRATEAPTTRSYGRNGNGQSSSGGQQGSGRPTRGTWTRRGRTLVIQL
ncbi:hypothetical protein [Hymenobacter rubripertinctus]|nr:hypothetical protein [Hymenobacter rubripertinctus]